MHTVLLIINMAWVIIAPAACLAIGYTMGRRDEARIRDVNRPERGQYPRHWP